MHADARFAELERETTERLRIQEKGGDISPHQRPPATTPNMVDGEDGVVGHNVSRGQRPPPPLTPAPAPAPTMVDAEDGVVQEKSRWRLKRRTTTTRREE